MKEASLPYRYIKTCYPEPVLFWPAPTIGSKLLVLIVCLRSLKIKIRNSQASLCHTPWLDMMAHLDFLVRAGEGLDEPDVEGPGVLLYLPQLLRLVNLHTRTDM